MLVFNQEGTVENQCYIAIYIGQISKYKAMYASVNNISFLLKPLSYFKNKQLRQDPFTFQIFFSIPVQSIEIRYNFLLEAE